MSEDDGQRAGIFEKMINELAGVIGSRLQVPGIIVDQQGNAAGSASSKMAFKRWMWAASSSWTRLPLDYVERYQV